MNILKKTPNMKFFSREMSCCGLELRVVTQTIKCAIFGFHVLPQTLRRGIVSAELAQESFEPVPMLPLYFIMSDMLDTSQLH